MNEMRKQLEKKPIQKMKKNIENQSQIAACEQKTTCEKANFVQTPFSHSTLKLELKKYHAAKPLAFLLPFLVSAWPKSLLQNQENVWTDLKTKDSAPIIFKFFEL